MKLWSGVLSPFSAKVRIALAEKGLPHEVLDVSWTRERKWIKPEGLLAVSPRGEVPVLMDGGLAIHDSTVILEYLEERYGGVPLLPEGAVERARCRMAEDDADQMLAGPISTLIQEVFLGAGDTARIAEARGELERWVAGLERALGDEDHLCGRFGVADIASFVAAGFASALGVPPGDGVPKVKAWLARVAARPHVKSEFEALTAAAAPA